LKDGYLVINDAFSEREVSSALNGLLDLIDGAQPDFQGIQFEARAVDLLPTLEREQKQDVVRKLMDFVRFDERLAAISSNPSLLGVLERIMGEPPDLFQDQALLKPPLIGREKPWHQDNAFFSLPADAMIVGAWIALDEAVPENGCMHIIPGTHRAGPVPHFQRRDWQLCDTDVAVSEVVAVPLKPGSCLLFHGLIHHGTPPSRSPNRRRALQLHYKPASVGRTSEDERLAVFGADGKDVTC
jgi:phytanoyl-CoA hydroxylase